MAKTESTAVTRLIELSQQRAVKGDLDWFAPARPRRSAREEVTQVVRIARRALRVSPGTVLAAFLAGMLTVIVTTLVLRHSAPPPSPPPPPPAPVVAAVVTPIPDPPAREPVPMTVAVAVPETVAVPATETETAIETETATETATETVVAPVAPSPRAPRAAPRPRALKPTPRTRVPARPTADTGALSELRINSKPPCELTIDGRSIGWTPQRGISVAPGRHTVIFRNREQGVERKVIVDAKVGQVHKLIRDFTEP